MTTPLIIATAVTVLCACVLCGYFGKAWKAAQAAAAASAGRERSVQGELEAKERRLGEVEREMGERAAAFEKRNQELGEALDRLRRAQDDVLRNEKLASMGRLVAGVAHEVNNPMNAVINTLGPLDEAIAELRGHALPAPSAALVAEIEKMLAVVRRGATRTKGIVQALHNYSRGDTETLKDLNLLRALDETLDLLRHRLGKIEVIKEIDAAARVTGFAGQIDQVLMNLLTNAVQAIGDKPGTIRVGLHRRGQEVWLVVGDDGPGIPKETLPRIFDPFFTTKDVGEGAGLGLSIVHGIVERHGGRIEVDSEPGKGTTFRVILPVHAGFVAAIRATTAKG